jgi:hypothetical protein
MRRHYSPLSSLAAAVQLFLRFRRGLARLSALTYGSIIQAHKITNPTDCVAQPNSGIFIRRPVGYLNVALTVLHREQIQIVLIIWNGVLFH